MLNSIFSDTAVVILNYNGSHFLEKFLPSVLACTPYAQIIVADNASTDDSIQILASRFPEVKVIQLPENYGFAKGYNEAIKQIQAKYIVLLNSDVQITENWLAPMLDLMENNPKIAACQPKIKDFNRKTHFEYAGAAGGFLDKWGYAFCRGRIFDELEEDKGQYNASSPVFWATGACMCVRASVYSELGGLDAYFFAHFEEIDLCWRMKNADYEIYYCADSEVFHVGGGTLNKSNPKKTFLNFRNNLITLYKNMPYLQGFFTIFLRLCLDALVGFQWLLQGKWKDIWAIIKAHYAFYYYVIFVKKQQKVFKKPISKIKEIYPESIIQKYFIAKKRHFTDLLWNFKE
jgi:GT2 family glycosyltransferase